MHKNAYHTVLKENMDLVFGDVIDDCHFALETI